MSDFQPSAESQWVEALWRLKGFGLKSIQKVLAFYSSLEEFKRQSEEMILKTLHFLSEPRKQELLNFLCRETETHSYPYLSFLDSLYPQKLHALYQPPAVLYFLGNIQILEHAGPWIGIVGTRMASQYALRQCRQFIEGFQSLHPVIVSGMALGVDGMAHEVALELRMKTVGILGTGLEEIYPEENRPLFEKMSKEGLLLSELPAGTETGPWHFPERNRLIAALCDVLVIVEAPQRSGALLTARHALELGKEIFVIPGSLESVKNVGGHKLIQEGAQLLLAPEQVYESLKIITSPRSMEKNNLEGRLKKPCRKMTPEEEMIVKILEEEAQHIDKIVYMSHLPAPLVTGMLIELTLEGLVRENPGKVFEIIK